jgi:hypothetical protein
MIDSGVKSIGSNRCEVWHPTFTILMSVSMGLSPRSSAKWFSRSPLGLIHVSFCTRIMISLR